MRFFVSNMEGYDSNGLILVFLSDVLLYCIYDMENNKKKWRSKMAKLYFKFGAMGSSKTANALMTAFNYEEKGQNVLLLKPSIDTRDDEVDENGERIAIMKSRIGLSRTARLIEQGDNLIQLFKEIVESKTIDAIICDECQFCTEKQINQLKYLAEYENVPVLCFGLRSDFQTKLFPGSKRLFEIADSISEIKSICKCGNKAIVNARLDADGNIITEGEQVEIGGNEKYEAMCWKCWNDAKGKKSQNESELNECEYFTIVGYDKDGDVYVELGQEVYFSLAVKSARNFVQSMKKGKLKRTCSDGHEEPLDGIAVCINWNQDDERFIWYSYDEE